MSEPINDGGPAFARPAYCNAENGFSNDEQRGMSLRAYFAGQALTGEMANSSEGAWRQQEFADLAERCVGAADAIIKRLEQP